MVFFDAVMAFEDTKILKLNQYKSFVKTSCNIYKDLESLIKSRMVLKIILKKYPQQK